MLLTCSHQLCQPQFCSTELCGRYIQPALVPFSSHKFQLSPYILITSGFAAVLSRVKGVLYCSANLVIFWCIHFLPYAAAIYKEALGWKTSCFGSKQNQPNPTTTQSTLKSYGQNQHHTKQPAYKRWMLCLGDSLLTHFNKCFQHSRQRYISA